MRAEKEKELQEKLDSIRFKEIRKVKNNDEPFHSIETYEATLTDGTQVTLERIIRGGNKKYNVSGGDAVAVLPITENGEVVFVIQPRSIGPCIEIPAGYINKGELPINAAIRELEEETGLICDRKNIHEVDINEESTGSMTSKVHIYIAGYCIDTLRQHLDENEHILLLRCTLEEGKELFMNRRLNGSSSKLAFSMGSKYLVKERS